MSVSYDQTTALCSTTDVSEFFEQFDAFDTTTDPSDTVVQKRIRAWSGYVERKTRNSWRANRVTEETHQHKHLYYWMSGHPIRLMKRNIRPLDDTQGDKLEVWTGNGYEEWISDTSRTEGRENDYWLDAPAGILYVFDRAILRPQPKFRVTYRYGYENVPEDIRDAIAKLVARDLVNSDIYGTTIPGNQRNGNVDIQASVQNWWEEAHSTITAYKRVAWV